MGSPVDEAAVRGVTLTGAGDKAFLPSWYQMQNLIVGEAVTG
jgi:hypothetical protein